MVICVVLFCFFIENFVIWDVLFRFIKDLVIDNVVLYNFFLFILGLDR